MKFTKSIIAISIFASSIILSGCATTQKKVGYAVSSDLWTKGTMPGSATTAPTAYKMKPKNILIQYNVSNPEIELYKAESLDGKPTAFVVICPGGGYSILATLHEGTEIAHWLNQRGISALVLKYRVPNNPQGALMDAQRAIRTARANAKKWNIDPNKIAIMGFSAGASLSARASTNYNVKTYEPIDIIDSYSARPDATILVYPAYCDKNTNDKRWKNGKTDKKDYNSRYRLADELSIDKNTPPAFIIQTQEDWLIDSAFTYYLALKDARVPASLHIFPKGKHGYGLRPEGTAVDEWDYVLEAWLKEIGFCKK
ncbi:MAG: alpha/beta hydrolase [Opitutales bacterium]|nr:alpha/beta hydrolase [Opitutales bacterium]